MTKARTQSAGSESASEQVKALVQDVTAEAKGSSREQLREQITPARRRCASS